MSAEATDTLGEPDHEGQGQSQIGHSPNLLDSLVALPLQGIRYISSEIEQKYGFIVPQMCIHSIYINTSPGLQLSSSSKK